ncbi:MAG: hypothetical protein ACJ0BE_05730 [Dehalococcoidia bacterium]|jgi:hypothetical protein
MFHVQRVFKSKPGKAREVATLAHKAAKNYNDAGQREEGFRVYFNIGTTPGEKNIVVLSWTADSLESVFRGENDVPKENIKIWKALVSLTEDNWIEFDEFLTDEKMVDVQSYIDAIK